MLGEPAALFRRILAKGKHCCLLSWQMDDSQWMHSPRECTIGKGLSWRSLQMSAMSQQIGGKTQAQWHHTLPSPTAALSGFSFLPFHFMGSTYTRLHTKNTCSVTPLPMGPSNRTSCLQHPLKWSREIIWNGFKINSNRECKLCLNRG